MWNNSFCNKSNEPKYLLLTQKLLTMKKNTVHHKLTRSGAIGYKNSAFDGHEFSFFFGTPVYNELSVLASELLWKAGSDLELITVRSGEQKCQCNYQRLKRIMDFSEVPSGCSRSLPFRQMEVLTVQEKKGSFKSTDRKNMVFDWFFLTAASYATVHSIEWSI